MRRSPDVSIIGAGIGGLACAIQLATRGLSVAVFESREQVGGKAAVEVLDGVEVDTGPSVLTLVDVFEELFAVAGSNLHGEVELTRPEPGFRYLYPDGATVEVRHDKDATLDSVATSLGSRAREELDGYLRYAERIWLHAAPNFVMTQAPEMSGLLFGGFKRLGAVSRIDPFRTLASAIETRVKDPHLRDLLKRYATYNGSDVRTAPATLGCIAHVELSLGGFGVKGGMVELARAMERVAMSLGVTIELGQPVRELLVVDGSVVGIELAGGRRVSSPRVVLNADVGALRAGLLGADVADRVDLPQGLEPSMSAHTGILKAWRSSRAAHTVIFPRNYDAEFEDIFDRGIVPQDPTVYLCAQEVCHGRTGWPEHEPLFAMVNAPAVSRTRQAISGQSVQDIVTEKCRARDQLRAEDEVLWWRTPEGLAHQFPGSDGALYGAASNGPSAAFRRPANRLTWPRGLFLASGSAHPGGGVPMVAQSGKQAALAILKDRKLPR